MPKGVAWEIKEMFSKEPQVRTRPADAATARKYGFREKLTRKFLYEVQAKPVTNNNIVKYLQTLYELHVLQQRGLACHIKTPFSCKDLVIQRRHISCRSWKNY